MTSLRHLLSQSVLAKAEAELKERESLAAFEEYLTLDEDRFFLRALHRFVELPPWRYWDPNVVANALELLERSGERTASAMEVRARQIGTGFENLFRPAATSDHEERINLTKSRDLFRVATEFHPEYLRRAEHIFSNLLTLYWSILKRGDVRGKYDLRGAVALLNQKGYSIFAAGYNDDIRNAIAHGEVVFTGLEGIQYGPDRAQVKFASYDFLSHFDSLWRTSNNLAIAILLFIARNRDLLSHREDLILPPSLIAFLAAAGVERTGFRVVGVVESNIHRLGKQLHLAVHTASRNRVLVLLECAQLSMHLLQNGGTGYARYVFDIDQGQAVTSLVAVKVDRLAALIEEDAGSDKLGEVFDTTLLWYGESDRRAKLKAWKLIWDSQLEAAKDSLISDWRRLGLIGRGRRRYRIRKIENVSVENIARVNVIVVLKHASDANDRETIRGIVYDVIKKTSKRWVDTREAGIDGRGAVRRPSYVWVHVYKLDGTIRWLNGCDWRSGNLVAMAERVYGLLKRPLQIHNPEETWRSIRIRYSMDMELLRKVFGDSDFSEGAVS